MKHIFFFLIIFTSSLSLGQEVKKEYAQFIKEIKVSRDAFASKYALANSIEKKNTLKEARIYLRKTITSQVFPYWYGTPWDFNGTTRTPQKGTIACGYFVTNILTDVGFRIPRVKWAQSASEVFIKKLSYGNIKRFSNTPISAIENYLITKGNRLYLVGLDMHTGFIYVNANEIRFIHADYYEPEIGVVSEKLDSESPIRDSKYRVIGKLFSDKMMLHWINNQPIY